MGVNKYRLADEPEIEVREVDNAGVREQQIGRIRMGIEHNCNRDPAANDGAYGCGDFAFRVDDPGRILDGHGTVKTQ